MPQNIAIVGLSVEIPSGTDKNLDHASFFKFLLDGQQSYEKIPTSRFNVDAWHGTNTGQISTTRGTFLKDVNLFDNVEFGVSVKDARAMAASTRKLIEHSFLALYDSGIDYRSRNIGCFTAGSVYSITNVSETDEFDAEGSFAGAPSMMANRVSYHLDLRGPSIPSDTACSSSCTALHLAVNALLCGDCDAAVIGGCQLNHQFSEWFNYSLGQVLAKDGRCKPFDKSADGFSRGEAAGAIVIKPLKEAVKDGDHIYGLIQGTAVNASGSLGPPNAPVAEAQRDVMLNAFRRAGRLPSDVDYVECHATGTARGDPVEANWVGKACQRDDQLLIGSVKGNVGHTEISSFLVSLSKVLSMFEHEVIPPNVNLLIHNPAIAWEAHQLHVPLQKTPLPSRSGLASLVGIASSAIGGSNAHVVVESFPPYGSSTKQSYGYDIDKPNKPILLMAGGLSPRSATSIFTSALRYAEDHPDLIESLAVDMGRRTRQMTWRTFSIITKDTVSNVNTPPPTLVPQRQPQVIFVLSGQGPQYNDMGCELFETFPVFRESVSQSDQIYLEKTGKSLICDYGLFDSRQSSRTPPTHWSAIVTLPAIAVFQIAMVDLLTYIGIRPDVVVGHSAGETTALYASGAGSRAMALGLAIARGIAFSFVEGEGGTMAALGCGAEDAQQLIQLAQCDNKVDIACYNSPTAVAIAGKEDAIDQVLSMATARGFTAQKLKTKVPVHSNMMELCREEYQGLVGDVFACFEGDHRPRVQTVSTLTGSLVTSSYNDAYFWDNARAPVQFTRALETIIGMDSNDPIFIEISPHPVLASYMQQQTRSPDRVLSCARRPAKDHSTMELVTFTKMLGNLTVHGYNGISFHLLYQHAQPDQAIKDKRIIINYPFSKKVFPLYPNVPAVQKQLDPHNGPLNHKYLRINDVTHPCFVGHIVRGELMMPAAGFIEMAFEFGATCLFDIVLHSILPLKVEKPVPVNVALDGCCWSVGSVGEHHSESRLHANGYLAFEQSPVKDDLDLWSLRRRCDTHYSTAIYPALAYALNYGPSYQRVLEVNLNRNEAFVVIEGVTEDLPGYQDFILHPAVLDACFHVLCYRPFHGNLDSNVYYLPDRLGKITLHCPPKRGYLSSRIYAHYAIRSWAPDHITYDITIADKQGKVLCSIEAFEARAYSLHHLPEPNRFYDVVYQPFSVHPQPIDLTSKVASALYDSLWRSLTLMNLSEDKNPHSDSLLYSRSLRCAREYLSWLSRQKNALKICIIGLEDTDALRAEIAQLLSDDLNASITYLLCNSSRLLECDSITVHGQCRAIHFDHPLQSQELQSHSFDLVIFVQSVHAPVSPESPFLISRELLVPGGCMLMIDNTEGAESAASSKFSAPLCPGQSSTEDKSLSGETGFKSIYSTRCLATNQIGVSMAQFLPCAHDDIYSPFIDDTTVIYMLSEGCELNLQWILSGLDQKRGMTIWITALAGREGDEASGLIRVLAREFPAWRLRLAQFPSSYSYRQKHRFLLTLPRYFENESEILVTTDGRVLVPRVVSHQSLKLTVDSGLESPILTSPSLVVVNVIAATPFGSGYGFVGRSMSDTMGSLLAGITPTISNGYVVAEQACLFPLDKLEGRLSASREDQDILAASIPGLVTAALSVSLSVFNRPACIDGLLVLLTHSSSPIACVVNAILSTRGARVVEVGTELDVMMFSSFQSKSFDIIVSGHTDFAFSQLCKRLLRQSSSRVFLWNAKDTGLCGIAEREPYMIADALAATLPLFSGLTLPTKMAKLCSDNMSMNHTLSNSVKEEFRQIRLFMPDKTYVLLGGIGSLGPHIALWMYECGARHIVLTSRAGDLALNRDGNEWSHRIVQYLRTCSHLQLRLEKVDAGDPKALQTLLSTLVPAVAGGFILTAATSDAFFMNLTTDDFEHVRKATSRVFDALTEVVDVEQWDFLVHFSSVSAVFGNAGQSTYSSCKCVVDGAIGKLQNAFSFVCPPIQGTTMVDNPHKRLLGSWRVSVHQMLQWLQDGMLQLFSGRKIRLYIPEMDWAELTKAIGPTDSIRHLLSSVLSGDSVAAVPADPSKALVQVIQKSLEIPEDEITMDVPLTSYGLDSLVASRLSFSLEKDFGLSITQIQLLSNMTTADLLNRLSVQALKDIDFTENGLQQIINTMKDTLRHFYADYTKELSTPGNLPSARGKSVLLTGATGTLGSHILFEIIQAEDVETVHVLIRRNNSSTLETLLESALKRERLPLSIMASRKLRLHDFSVGQASLSLSPESIDELSSSVTHIIHSAWKAHDFASPLSSYHDLLEGTRTLINLAVSSKLASKPSFIFISTVSVCKFKASSVPIQEEQITLQDLENIMSTPEEVGDSSGYLQSKWVCEQMLEEAVQNAKLPALVVRVGQLTGGPRTGMWRTFQWFPALVKSALFVNCLPDGNGLVSWMPVSLAASAIADMYAESKGTVHLVHPRPVSWKSVLTVVAREMNVSLVPYTEWFNRLETGTYSSTGSFPITSNFGSNLALALTDFYRIGTKPASAWRYPTEAMNLEPEVSLSRAIQASKTLANAEFPQLCDEDVKDWIEEWRRDGFLPRENQ